MGAIHRRTTHGWEGVVAEAYKAPSLAGVRKHELISEREGANEYRIRYFEVPAGGRTAHERHAHDHGVVIVTGRARVTLGDETHEVSAGDVVDVEGDEQHCVEALGE